MESDTICAISTPYGISGIGIIRISGKLAFSIIGKIFKPARKQTIEDISSHTVVYGHITDEKGKIVDEVLVTFMKSPRSYTREDIVEIGCHGGIVPLREILHLCITSGARLALPGEFTKRAFINGRIDLTQAESVLEIINSKTEKSLALAMNKLQGNLKNMIQNIRQQILEVLVSIEASINFPEEEDIKHYDINIQKTINSILIYIENFIKRAGKGKIIYGGINAAIVGRTNVGKSSLLNALLREDRAIVTEVAGTTRDALRETINIKGIPVNIIDTAGLQKVRGRLAYIGIKKSLEWIEKAEINLLVLDGTKRLNSYDRRLLSQIKKKPYIVVVNKIDLPLKIEIDDIKKTFSKEEIVFLSAKTGKGIDEIEEKMYSLIQDGYGIIENNEIFLNVRQENKIKTIYNHLLVLKNDTCLKNNLDIVAQQIKNCLQEIDKLTGRKADEEVLNQIFSQFCIGK